MWLHYPPHWGGAPGKPEPPFNRRRKNITDEEKINKVLHATADAITRHSEVLHATADAITRHSDYILAENKKDLAKEQERPCQNGRERPEIRPPAAYARQAYG
ncbi:hypothetical protein QE152_g41595, partial [Popillia japonica]